MSAKPDKLLLPHETLRKRLNDAGVVFDFIVHSWLHPELPTEADHADEVRALFEMLQDTCAKRRETLLRQHPDWKSDEFWMVTFDLAKAAASPWCGLSELNDPGIVISSSENKPYVNDFTCLSGLEAGFWEPPYGIFRTDPDLFSDFCSSVGLSVEQNIDVIDWTGGRELDPAHSTWSNYFEDGREGWGICCLTIWNPESLTLATIAASATD